MNDIQSNMNNVDIKIKFWIELWEDLINNFLKKSFGLTLYNPHILIDDIITEIDENAFKNSDNKKFFYSKLSEYLKNDLVINKKLKSQFKILRKTFNSERTGYILETCREIKDLFQKGLYFDCSLDLIIDLLISDEEISIDFVNSINYLTQGIIVELIKKTYAIKDIKKFPTNIFDNYSYADEKILITKFPHGLDHEKYKNPEGDFNREKYNEDVIKYISNLSTKDRIQKLSYYYHKKKEKAFYIFVIEGLKGDIDITVSGVTFYSLNKKRLIKEINKEFDFEELQRHQRNEKFIQAAVEVDFLMPESSLAEALTKLENALDLISCYFNLKTDLYLNNLNYSIVNQEGHSIYSSMGRDKRNSFMKYQDSLYLNDIENDLKELNKYSFLWADSSKSNKSISKIVNALHWYRKAEHSLKQEDKMLNYWIAIENLFNLETDIKLDVLNDSNKSKFHLIQETISSIWIFVFIYEFGWELYHYYNLIFDNHFSNNFNFPENLIQKAQLRPEIGEKIYLKNFIDNLNEISQYEKNPFILDKINRVKDFYENSTITKKMVDGQINQIKNDVLMIYRIRNLIVHNAHFDNTLLPYFVWKIKGFSGNLIRRIISDFSFNKELSDIIVRIHLKREKFLCDFDNGKVNLFKD